MNLIKFWKQFELNSLRKFLDKLSEPILEIGCSDGATTNELFPKDKKVYGIDLTFSGPYGEGNYFPFVERKICDCCDIKYPDETFNSAISVCVMEHIYDINKALSEISRVLKKDGYFLFSVPNPNFRKYLLFKGIPILNKIYPYLLNLKFHHYNLLTVRNWEYLLNKHNMELVGYYGFCSPNNSYYLDRIRWAYKFLPKKILEKVSDKWECQLETEYWEENPREYTCFTILAQKK